MSSSFSTLVLLLGIAGSTFSAGTAETAAGWQKLETNPALGGDLGTCFDVSVLKDGDKFRMWFSWRPKAAVALVESDDGVQWSEPVIVLPPNRKTDWEERINRPVVLKRDGLYHMWYTAQIQDRSWIGYATSPDGLRWTRHPSNPIFRPDPESAWEKHKVTACQVVREGRWYVMFYTGFADEHTAQIGIARSRNGITGWQRHPDNPIIRARVNRDDWDYDACYKPYAIFHEGQWMLWYNGRKGGLEQIGLATHPGRELWPPPDPAPTSRLDSPSISGQIRSRGRPLADVRSAERSAPGPAATLGGHR